MKTLNWGVSAVASLAAGIPGVASASEALVRPVVLVGDPAPSLPGVRFAAVSDPRINIAGHVVFWARLTGTGVTPLDDVAIWTNRNGAFSPVIRKQQFIPDRTGNITGIPTASFNDSNLIALAASFADGSPTTTSLVALTEEPQNTFTILLKELQNNTFTAPALVPLAGSGETVLWNTASRSNSITFSQNHARDISSSTLAPEAGSADIPADATFRQISPPTFAGTAIAFRAAIGNSATTAAWKYGVFSDRTGQAAIVALAGRQVTGGPGGQFYREFSNTPTINAPGDVAFWARLEGAGAPAGEDAAILVSPAGSPNIRQIAKIGQPAPGTTLAAFGAFNRRIALSDTGRVVFGASLFGGGASPGNNSGLWISDVGAPLKLLAREGAAAPGAVGANFAAFFDPRVGADDQIAFLATLTGPGVNAASATALFATDLTGVVRMIIREGDSIAVNESGPPRIVRQIVFDHEDGHGGSSQMSNGVLVFKLGFTDNSSGIFSATIPCFGDFNHDGAVDGTDLTEYYNAWLMGDSSADANIDGGVDGADLEAFFGRWSAGVC